LTKRVLCLGRPNTRREIGKEFGITQEWVRQIERGIRRRLFHKRRQLSEQLSVVVKQFRTDIGEGIILEEAKQLLSEAGVTSGATLTFDVSTTLFLYLAGPYHIWNDLLVLSTFVNKLESLRQKFWNHLQQSVLTIEQADELANTLGIHSPDIVNSVLTELQHRYSHLYNLSGGRYAYYPHAVDRAVMYLENEAQPMDVDSLAALCGVSSGGLLNAMSLDDRLVCVDRRTYGLRSWGFKEYEGVVGSIHQALEYFGGRAYLYDVADWITEHFNVSWSSVITYATSHRDFMIEDGMLRTRSSHEAVRGTIEKDIGAVGGCLIIDGHPALRVVIDSQLWRGSGRPIPRAWALKAGLNPGEKLVLGNNGRTLVISWIGNEPALGSMRNLALSDSWPEHGLGFIILADDKLVTVTTPPPPKPSTDANIIASAMNSLFAISHNNQGHPLSGFFGLL